MIANLIGGFISILVGVSLIGPVADEVETASNATSSLATTTPWGATVLKLVPGFFALSILGVGVAVTYTSLRQAGIV
jgi:hypothetical protein